MATVIIVELHNMKRGINMTNSITKRKDGRFMGRFIIGHGDDGKAIYQYVYGSNNDEALKRHRSVWRSNHDTDLVRKSRFQRFIMNGSPQLPIVSRSQPM